MNVDAIFDKVGQFSVRFRWLMALAWIAGAVAARAFLPSLASVTQNDNAKFLPASAPVEHAIKLAAPFGMTGLVDTTVIAARSGAHITPADIAALTRLRHVLSGLPTVAKVGGFTVSADSQA